ncbi:unnamed protein product [Effrenium voratum]|nr:unnamed protein product [Effrenium voratum]
MTEEFSLPPPKGVEVRPDGFIQALDEVYGQLKAAHEREIQAQHQNDLVHIQLQLSQLHEAHERLRQAKPKKRKPKTNAQREPLKATPTKSRLNPEAVKRTAPARSAAKRTAPAGSPL